MATFELNALNEKAGLTDGPNSSPSPENCDDTPLPEPKRLREECLISLKVYDSCRQQNCLTEKELGPAWAVEDACGMDAGEEIVSPTGTNSVTIERLHVKKIQIVEKKPCQFKQGFWDIDLRYVFEYVLVFHGVDGNIICAVLANSIYNKKVTLFGSAGQDVVLATDLLKQLTGDSTTMEADPFILVEAKAVGLSADINICGHEEHRRVAVTIGLFTIIKLFRIVQLLVESKGFCIPDECHEILPLNPCEFFYNLDFPMDIFAPPQRPDVKTGISGNISKAKDSEPCES